MTENTGREKSGNKEERGTKSAKKLFYRMGEVCEMTGLESHVLRFWEAEFPLLKPGKNRSGHRVFSHEDVALVLRIKGLLHDQGYTIAGAVKKLGEAKKTNDSNDSAADLKKVREALGALRTTVQNVLNLLDRDSGIR